MHHTYTSIIILLFFTRLITPNNKQMYLLFFRTRILRQARDKLLRPAEISLDEKKLSRPRSGTRK